jgi:uncharacterized membrane protein YkvA (DUF1232 family)
MFRLAAGGGHMVFTSARVLSFLGDSAMEEIGSIIRMMVGCGTLLGLAFMGLLAMPKCKLRAVLMQIVGWATTVFCIVYGISPIDIVPEALFGPFGLIDDLVAVGIAIASGSAAMQSGRDLKALEEAESAPRKRRRWK